MSYLVSWSGGKDCCLACYKAMAGGKKITQLLNLLSKQDFHRLDRALLRTQADAMDIRIQQHDTTWETYEADLKALARAATTPDTKGIIFGDQYVTEFKVQKHKEWVDRVCKELGMEAVEPLWGLDPDTILLEFIDAGFEAIILSAKVDVIDRKWVGQKVDREFLQYLKRKNINACGELGEYHTFVVAGPLFKQKIQIQKSRIVKKGKYWFLEIQKYASV